jgi:hypothetical protein
MEIKNTLVTIRFNKATKGKKDPQATVNQDVYRDGELIIRAGTPVKMERKTTLVLSGTPVIFSSYGTPIKTNDKIEGKAVLTNFSTNSIYGNNLQLKGNYQLDKQRNNGQYNAGLWLTIFVFPIGIPIWATSSKYPKIPAGTLLYVEME